MDFLFEVDKLLKLIIFLFSKSSSVIFKVISLLVDSYDGMMLGYELKWWKVLNDEWLVVIIYCLKFFIVCFLLGYNYLLFV